MRILNESSKPADFTELGFWGTALEDLKHAIIQPHGMVLVTGPTGSGKSTTLFSVLSSLNTPGVNISTVEDPVEYHIVGANQTQVNPLAGMTFTNGLRALLRQDPNIIMVGEIRDGETADLAVQAALTGHLVFSTLHTNNAATCLPRLLDMGVEPFLLASSLIGVLAQRLVRVLEPSMREAYGATASELGGMHGRQLRQHRLGLCRELQHDPPPVAGIADLLRQTRPDQPAGQFLGGIRSNQQCGRQIADAEPSVRCATDGEDSLMLLRRQSGRSRRRLAERGKFPQGPPEIGQRHIVDHRFAGSSNHRRA